MDYHFYGKNHLWCELHKELFLIGNKCIKCFPQEMKPIGNVGFNRYENNPLKFPVETKKQEKVSVMGGAYGHDMISAKQSKALLLYENNMSFGDIAKTLNIKKGSVQNLLKKAIRNANRGGLTVKRVGLTIANRGGLTVRLHDDEFKVKVLADYGSLNFPIKNVNKNLEYKLIKIEGMHCKLHKNNTFTFRFINSIFGITEDEVLLSANQRLKNFLDTFFIKGVQLVSSVKLLSRHYGIVGSGFARKIRDDKMMIIIVDGDDGKIRIRADFSNDVPEIDAEHLIKAKSDSEVTREYLKDLINNPHYLPSEIKLNFDTIMAVQNAYAENIKKHLEVMENINRGIEELRRERI